MQQPIFLSVIIPAHNEAHRLPGTLDTIFEYFNRQSYSTEVLVVENGSQDNTLEIAEAYASRYPQLRVAHTPMRGKGLAIQKGMLAARGEYRFMCDADLSMPIQEISRFLPPALKNFDLAIGSREVEGAVRYNEPGYRHLLGRSYNALIRALALPGLQDTQCGFKCVRGAITEMVFKRQTLTGLSFDVEVLFIARHLGLRIVEIPIHWYFNPDSRVRILQDSIRMGLDLIAIRRNAHQGAYDNQI